MTSIKTVLTATRIVFFAALAILILPGYALPKDSFKPFKLKTPEGSSKTLENFLNKATVVTFFFPTCGYCNAAYPHLQKIFDKYKDQGLSMVSINVVEDQDGKVAEWQSTHKYTIPVLIGATLDSIQKNYDLKSTPTHILLDSKGKVLFKLNGYKAGDETVLEERIQKALNPAP